MTGAELWLTGFLVGIALGIPIGAFLYGLLGPVDRWLDDHWGR